MLQEGQGPLALRFDGGVVAGPGSLLAYMEVSVKSG